MALINNSQVIQKLVDELKLYPGKDLIPSELADKILAVYQINDQAVTFKTEGDLRIVNGSGAGNTTVSLTVPTDKKWKLSMFSGKLVTDANAANRRVRLQITDESDVIIMEGNNLGAGTDGVLQTASKTRYYNLSTAAKPLNTDTLWSSDGSDPISYNFSLPIVNPSDFWIPAGWKIKMSAGAGLAGDAFTIKMIVREEGEKEDFQS